MRRLLLLAALLLASSSAFAQIETTPPSAGASSGGSGAPSFPLVAPLGCTTLKYSFTGGTVAGAGGYGICEEFNQLTLWSGGALSAVNITSTNAWNFGTNAKLMYTDAGLVRQTTGIVAVTGSDSTLLGVGLNIGPSLGMGATGAAIGSPDAGLARNAAAVTAFTNGSGTTGTGRILLADGTPGTNCAIGFNGGACITATSSPAFDFGTTAAGWLGITGTTAVLPSASQFVWSSGTIRAAGPDTGLKRATAGTVQVTNGSSGNGLLIVDPGSVNAVGFGFVGFTNSGIYYDTTANDAVTLAKGGIQRELVTGDRTLTDATATTIFQVAIADANMVTLAVDYHVRASNATPDYQAISGTFYVSIVNKGGTETCSTVTEAGEQSAVSAGTITFTATCDTSPANAVNIQVNSDSSLTTPTIIGQFAIRRGGTGGSITIS